MHKSNGYVGPVTLLDGGEHVEGDFSKAEAAEARPRTDMTQSQIDATFNPEKDFVIGTIQEGLAQQISDQTQAELDRLKYDMYMEGFNKGVDNLLKFSGLVAVSPFVIGGAAVYGGVALSYSYSGLKFVATSYHYTFGVNGGYANMDWNVGGQLAQASVDPNYRVDLLGIGLSGFITNLGVFSGGTPLYQQALVGVGSSFIQVGTNGITVKKLNGATTASTVNSTLGISYSNSIYGNNGASLIINSLLLQTTINRMEQKYYPEKTKK